MINYIICFLQKSYNSGHHTNIMLRDVSKEDPENEMASVVFEMKMELAGMLEYRYV